MTTSFTAAPTPVPDPPDLASAGSNAAFALQCDDFVAYQFDFGTWAAAFIPELEAFEVNVEAQSASATSSAAAAATSASGAATSATNAAASAASAVNAPGTSGTSTTSLAIGTGSKAFTTQSGKSWVVGQPVIAASASAPSTKWMAGIITAYSGTSLTVDMAWTSTATSTHADWTLALTAPTPTSIPWSALYDSINSALSFGDGSDGDVTVSAGTTTLTRNMFYNNLTINGTGSIDAAGWKIFVKGTLDLTSAPAGAIKRLAIAGGVGSGNTGGTPGAALATNDVGGAAAGSAGKNGAAASPGTAATQQTDLATYLGGLSGATRAAGDGTSGVGGAAASKPTDVQAIVNPLIGPYLTAGAGAAALGGCPGAGGASGGGDASAAAGGGAGGTGGGVLDIRAKIISRGASTAAGAIQCIGGAGGNGVTPASGNRGGAAGGAGAGGGFVGLMYETLSGATATNAIDVSGGKGGDGGTKTGTGTDGGGANGGDGGRVRKWDLGAGSYTSLVSAATGTAGSGTTGGAGAVAKYDL